VCVCDDVCVCACVCVCVFACMCVRVGGIRGVRGRDDVHVWCVYGCVSEREGVCVCVCV
jgi:hypothetical protein